MIRIRGRIGDWPVDLEIELEERDWSQLARGFANAGVTGSVPTTATPAADALWHSARERLRCAGKLDGPELLAELEALTGNAQLAKRLLVRLRHCDEVKVEHGADSPCYHWIGEPS
ncbi:hypothetical protein CXK93_19320 [Stutzerimonas decontaminans]|uniref:Uncharacterized protein n=2 Tax=Stutzerimonas TaxID=2901164 RepID=A0ABX4VSQ0_9GAMM|nr:hypothetical protein [Stutzerimonas decontaminans]AHY44261.1 hypothetical protein UIB01_18015 [Stutzerimonas decontaminans]MCQ4243971.1 hypothetical protein [Stutzerimonas decontaminans]MCW8158747.1 hypothetical protein [Stutzerimonas stutzeri]PNF83204.1 hypothetical protein CXK93_19320 [Stutzerimonas decontaminans]